MEALGLDVAYQRVLSWWSFLDCAAKDMYLNEAFPVRFSYNSGKIENDSITLHDTEEIVANGRVVSYTGDLRTLFEIGNLKSAWDFALDIVNNWPGLNVELLLEMQRVLTAGTYDERRWTNGERPGTFKKNGYIVADGVGYSPDEVPQAVDGLLEELDNALTGAESLPQGKKALVVSAYAHAKLVDIHPFADGNGRCARLLQNITLMRCGHPPIVIDEKDRMAYYGALDAFHAEAELGAFVEFCMVQTVKSWHQAALGN